MATATKKKTTKKTTKETTAKKTTKKAAPEVKKAAAKKKAADRSVKKGMPAHERRVALIKQLRKMKATSSSAAKPVALLAEKLGFTHHDVYCLTFHQYPLVAQGFLNVRKEEGERGLAVFLTKKGQTTKFDAPPFTRGAAK